MAVGTPSRTLGFLFADLRNYTRFVEAHGDTAASDLLQRYRALVRDTLQRFDGAEIRTEGDSFYIVLPSAGVAVQCGLAILQIRNLQHGWRRNDKMHFAVTLARQCGAATA